AVRTADVPVPVMVTVYVPNGVLESTSNVIVEALPAVTVSGLNVAVVPEGRPLTLSATVCAEPVATAVAIDVYALVPCSPVTVAGVAVSETSSAIGLPQPGNVREPIAVCPLK